MDLTNLSKWKLCDPQRNLVLRGKAAPRRIRLDLNASHETGVYVIHPDNTPQFVANVLGRQTVQFRMGGDVQIAFIVPNGGQCWFHTSDGETVHFEKPESRSFTKVWERKPRNRDMELLVYRQQRQNEAFMAKLAAESDRRIAAIERAATAASKPKEATKDDAKAKAGSDGRGDAPGKGRADERKAGDGEKPSKPETGKANGADEHGSAAT